jgi:hypothetical protein
MLQYISRRLFWNDLDEVFVLFNGNAEKSSPSDGYE